MQRKLYYGEPDMLMLAADVASGINQLIRHVYNLSSVLFIVLLIA